MVEFQLPCWLLELKKDSFPSLPPLPPPPTSKLAYSKICIIMARKLARKLTVTVQHDGLRGLTRRSKWRPIYQPHRRKITADMVAKMAPIWTPKRGHRDGHCGANRCGLCGGHHGANIASIIRPSCQPTWHLYYDHHGGQHGICITTIMSATMSANITANSYDQYSLRPTWRPVLMAANMAANTHDV